MKWHRNLKLISGRLKTKTKMRFIKLLTKRTFGGGLI